MSSPKNLELTPPITDTDLDLDIVLPLEIKHTVDGQLLYSYIPDSFRLVLKIYKNYTVLAEAHVLLMNDLDTLEKDNALLLNGLSKCIVVLEKTDEDREFIYDLRESDLAQMENNKRKQTIKTVLFTSGGVAVGVGIGILIGIFAI